MQQANGLDVRWLDATEAAATAVTLAPTGHRGGSYIATDGAIDPPRTSGAYSLAMQAAGVELRERTAFTALDTGRLHGERVGPDVPRRVGFFWSRSNSRRDGPWGARSFWVAAASVASSRGGSRAPLLLHRDAFATGSLVLVGDPSKDGVAEAARNPESVL